MDKNSVSMNLRGVIAAIPTPLNASGAPDAARFVSLAAHLLANGCDGLNVLGTTGEATSFTVEQRIELMTAIALDSKLPRERLMVGTGASAVGDAVRLTRAAAELDFAAALVLPPFYYKDVPDEGVIRYIDALVRSTGSGKLPVFLYHFPALSGVPYTLDLVTKLVAKFGDRVAGLKDSSGDLDYARGVAHAIPGFKVFPSNEATLAEARSGLFAGCISATANVNADLCARAYHRGDDAALEIATAIRRLFDGLPLVPGVKALLSHLHRDPSIAAVSPPLAPFGQEATARVTAGHDRLRQREAVRGASPGEP